MVSAVLVLAYMPESEDSERATWDQHSNSINSSVCVKTLRPCCDVHLPSDDAGRVDERLRSIVLWNMVVALGDTVVLNKWADAYAEYMADNSFICTLSVDSQRVTIDNN